jgi:hypothetical protein
MSNGVRDGAGPDEAEVAVSSDRRRATAPDQKRR